MHKPNGSTTPRHGADRYVALEVWPIARYMSAMTDDRSEKIAVRRRRLRFRCQRRGFKEVDLIFATFAEVYLTVLNEVELGELEILLEAPDQDVFAWLQDEAPVPGIYDNSVFAQLRALCRRKNPTWNV